MTGNQASLYLEQITHMTNQLPYSVHICEYDHPIGDTIYLHWHPEAEFLYLKKGQLMVMADQEEIILNQGEAVFIPPNRLHKAKSLSKQQGHYQAFVFSPALIGASFQRPQFQKYVQPIWEPHIPCCHFRKTVEWQKQVIFYFNQLIKAAEQGEKEKREDWGIAVTGFAMVMWQLLYRNHISYFCQDSVRQRLSLQMEKVFSYVHSHHGEEIRLGKLADLAHLSESQFCRSFKQLTGMSPFTYLNRYRIMQSCRLLLQTDKKISEIGTLCGFNTISYFNREFLKIVSVSPSVYRRQAREEKGMYQIGKGDAKEQT